MPRRTALAALTVIALPLAGCDSGDQKDQPTADPTVTVKNAQKTYSPTLSIVSSSIAASVPQPPPRVTREVIYFDGDFGSCAYAAHLTFPHVVFGTDVSWDDVRADAQGALTSLGFTLSDQLDIPGGYNGFDATARDGARIEVRSKSASPSTVTLYAPVNGSCSSDANQRLEPLDH